MVEKKEWKVGKVSVDILDRMKIIVSLSNFWFLGWVNKTFSFSLTSYCLVLGALGQQSLSQFSSEELGSTTVRKLLVYAFRRRGKDP